MPAWANQFNSISSRSECSISNAIDAWSIKTQKRIDLRRPASFGQKVTHAAQVSFTLFTNSSDKQNRTFSAYALRLNCLSECHQGGQARTIIGNAGCQEFVLFSYYGEISRWRKHCVEVRADYKQWRERSSSEQSETIAFLVNLNFCKSQVREL